MFKYIFPLICLFLNLSLLAQDCPPTDFVVNNQADLDSFALHYPDCVFFEHNLYIHAEDITDVAAFSNLETVEQLEISGTTNLTDLSGFNNLRQIVGALFIDLNTGLTQVNAFQELLAVGNINVRNNSNLAYFGGFPNLFDGSRFRFIDNPNLIEIHGFNKLIAILGFGIELDNLPALKILPSFDSLQYCYGPLTFKNTGLEHLDGFNKLDTLYQLEILENDLLLDINGFQFLHGIEYRYEISANTILTSILGFDQLNNTGQMWFYSNPELINISAYPNLVLVDDLELFYNDKLPALNGFNNLKQSLSDVLIISNANLISIQGFDQFTNTGRIEITDNQNLHTIQAFDNLRYAGSLIISLGDVTNIGDFPKLEKIREFFHFYNIPLVQLPSFNSLRSAGIVEFSEMPFLQDISGLNTINVETVEDFDLKDNPMLSDCTNTFVCNMIEQAGGSNLTTISNNKPECSDATVILGNCNDKAILNFDVFFDAFQNGLHDYNENNIGGIEIINQNTFQSYYTNPNGNTQIYLDPGTYTFSINPDPDQWLINTPTHTITLASRDNEIISIPLTPATYHSEIITHITSPPLRCNETIKLTVTMTNLGNTVASGRLFLDPIFSDGSFDFIDMPDTINSDFFGWNFEGLHPGQQQTKCIYFHVPGPPTTPVEIIYSFESYVDYNDIMGSHSSEIFTYDEVMRCSFDPNDKLVSPNRDSLENFTLFEEVLQYTIRFQNTGNDYARDIFILDSLDGRLDLETFVVTGSSHPNILTTSHTVGGFVKFDFSNIYLPDSTTDQEGSIGFVSYKIKPKYGLAEFNNIRNSASIYFDFNPPIHTNTTVNQLVNEIYTDNDADGFYSYEDCDDENSEAYPGAMEIVNNGIDEDCDGEDLISSTNDLLASDLQLFPNPAKDQIRWRVTDEVLVKKVRLYTVQGTLINELNGDASFINLTSIDPGYYLLVFDTKQGKCTKGFVKMCP